MDPPFDDQLKILEPPLFTNFNSPLIAKGHPRYEMIRDDFDKAFKQLIADGLYDDMIKLHGEEFVYQVPLHARR